MELHEHIKGEKERVTENPDAKKVLDNLENADHQGDSENDRKDEVGEGSWRQRHPRGVLPGAGFQRGGSRADRASDCRELQGTNFEE